MTDVLFLILKLPGLFLKSSYSLLPHIHSRGTTILHNHETRLFLPVLPSPSRPTWSFIVQTDVSGFAWWIILLQITEDLCHGLFTCTFYSTEVLSAERSYCVLNDRTIDASYQMSCNTGDTFWKKRNTMFLPRFITRAWNISRLHQNSLGSKEAKHFSSLWFYNTYISNSQNRQIVIVSTILIFLHTASSSFDPSYLLHSSQLPSPLKVGENNKFKREIYILFHTYKGQNKY